MSAAERTARRRPRIRQRGGAAVEVALLSVAFFTFVFGIIEVSRMLYVYNTLPEVTRRAAAAAVNVYPNDVAAVARLKQRAVFRDSPGGLILAPPVTDEYVRLDYLRFDLSVIPPASWPADAVTNRLICAANAHAADCIRFVQVQICDPADTGACRRVNSLTMIPFLGTAFMLSKSTTIAAVETLGYVPGTPPPCPCP